MLEFHNAGVVMKASFLELVPAYTLDGPAIPNNNLAYMLSDNELQLLDTAEISKARRFEGGGNLVR